jgi:hypothetical protein
MEEDWYSMEWVLADWKQETAAHAVRAARSWSEGYEAKRPKRRPGERRCRWRGVGEITASEAGAMVWTLATGVTLVGVSHTQTHWRRPPTPRRAVG